MIDVYNLIMDFVRLRIVVKKAAELQKLHGYEAVTAPVAADVAHAARFQYWLAVLCCTEHAMSVQCLMLFILLVALLPSLEDLPRKKSSKKLLLTAVDVDAFLPICNPPDPSLASSAIEWLANRKKKTRHAE
ncbi:uncharacterized protein MONOS_12390 [Monocercomonoides exilis]|uniref:uncharacterized protein n=1 Tax=Monocercomonoides exilis TaxID=2049356 RepID=UPI003559DECD|nr:hypothetical protein MONOS_12390 [Monocercomonoides exilis]|eukprot:MONOS_12390.1-p1 / transcript=MONOS_12390.1 / gene=MONOS_12390 / organism=Monocercomonoides_exilis_PA203 / gene_product=unspecified product / transcript_product=unspecified product / location=Mono_scaffold00682:24768-25460(-) / protein_length=132 / sequence_SO=supercontig / SO=protein_coding / is_pseudo=false